MGTVVRKEVYSPFQIYVLCVNEKKLEKDIFSFAGATLKVFCILNKRSLLRNFFKELLKQK